MDHAEFREWRKTQTAGQRLCRPFGVDVLRWYLNLALVEGNDRFHPAVAWWADLLLKNPPDYNLRFKFHVDPDKVTLL